MRLERLDRWIHGFLPVTAHGLALSRILFAAYFLLTGIPTFSWLSANPPAFFDPPPLSIAALFGRFPPAAPLYALDLLICVLLVFVLTGFKTRASSILLSFAWIVGNSFRYSFGKIDHSILAVVTPGVMAFSGWGAALSVDAKRGQETAIEGWPVTLLAVLLGFGFLSSGLSKVGSWADFDLGTQGARGWLISGWYGLGRRRLLAPAFMRISNGYVWETMDLMAVAFETLFVWSLARREWFRSLLFVALMFNLSNLLILNIAFLTLLPVYAVFAPWERLMSWLPQGFFGVVNRLASIKGVAGLLALFLPLYLLAPVISVDTAANGFSHLGVALDLLTSLDFDWVRSVTVLPAAVLLGVALAGSPQPRRRASGLKADRGGYLVFFDGVCNLCNGYVDFLIRHDRTRRLRFGSLQSEWGQMVHESGSGRVADGYYSIFVVDPGGRVYERSDAILKTVILLGGLWWLLACLWVVPRPIRDMCYRTVSRFRYRIFGKRESCRIPTERERAAFL